MNTKIIYLSEVTPDELQIYIAEDVCVKSQKSLYNNLIELAESYPKFEEWYQNKIINDLKLKNKKREVIIALNQVKEKMIVSGIVILKKDLNEKKICTIRVHENFRDKGLGTKLFKESFKYLETEKPLITISENRMNDFKNHIEKFEFELTETLPNYYKKGMKEYVFNGKLNG